MAPQYRRIRICLHIEDTVGGGNNGGGGGGRRKIKISSCFLYHIDTHALCLSLSTTTTPLPVLLLLLIIINLVA